jgi:hypothetical protein
MQLIIRENLRKKKLIISNEILGCDSYMRSFKIFYFKIKNMKKGYETCFFNFEVFKTALEVKNYEKLRRLKTSINNPIRNLKFLV